MAQSCDELVKVCVTGGMVCTSLFDQVLTDGGWCCQINLRKHMDESNRHLLINGEGYQSFQSFFSFSTFSWKFK